jgi:predicted transcriptional regulator
VEVGVGVDGAVDSGVRRVAVLGAECTGKSQLCQALALTLPGITFSEVLREWVAVEGRSPNAEEQFQLFARQQVSEEQAVIDALNRLPEVASLEEITEELHIMAAIRRGRSDIAAGRSKSHAEVEQLVDSWATAWASR